MSSTEGPEHTPAGPDQTTGSGDTPATGLEESDPNADSSEGLGGGMGVSSERRGPARGVGEDVTYGAAETHPEEEESAEGAPPEQSAFDGQPETNPESPGRHESDPDSNPRHGL